MYSMIKNYDAAIIDYNMGNLFSLKSICNYVGINAIITSDQEIIRNSKSIILPGVGAFGDAMNALEKLNLIDIIIRSVDKKKPLMGICLGMQLLFDASEEFGHFKGLGLVPGKVIKLSTSESTKDLKIPHIGWNQVYPNYSKDTIFQGIQSSFYAYFIHSFYGRPENESEILCRTEYDGFRFCSGVTKENILAFQFHPERSGKIGIQIFSNFKERIGSQYD